MSIFPQQSPTAAAWSRRLSRFAQSGQTVKAFCERELISSCSFYYWRRRLQSTAPETAQAVTASAFVDLGSMAAPEAGIDPDAALTMAPAMTIRLELPGAIVLTISQGQ